MAFRIGYAYRKKPSIGGLRRANIALSVREEFFYPGVHPERKLYLSRCSTYERLTRLSLRGVTYVVRQRSQQSISRRDTV